MIEHKFERKSISGSKRFSINTLRLGAYLLCDERVESQKIKWRRK